jgi:polar amino acid transport system substrate-binding protein
MRENMKKAKFSSAEPINVKPIDSKSINAKPIAASPGRAKSAAALFAAVLALSFGLFACSGPGGGANSGGSSTTSGAAPESTAASASAAADGAKKTLRVATSADYPPYEFHIVTDGKDNIVGFEMEAIRYVGSQLGYEVEIVDMEFDSILAAVGSGTVDCGIAAMSISDERKAAVDFTDYYYIGAQLMLIRAEDKDKYAKFEDLSGTPCAIQNGTIHEDLAIENIPGVVIKPYKTVAEMAMELKNGIVESACLDGYVAKAYAAKYSDLYVPSGMTFEASEDDSYAIVVKKGNAALLEELNSGIKSMAESGLMAEWIETANQQMMEESAE